MSQCGDRSGLREAGLREGCAPAWAALTWSTASHPSGQLKRPSPGTPSLTPRTEGSRCESPWPLPLPPLNSPTLAVVFCSFRLPRWSVGFGRAHVGLVGLFLQPLARLFLDLSVCQALDLSSAHFSPVTWAHGQDRGAQHMAARVSPWRDWAQARIRFSAVTPECLSSCGPRVIFSCAGLDPKRRGPSLSGRRVVESRAGNEAFEGPSHWHAAPALRPCSCLAQGSPRSSRTQRLGQGWLGAAKETPRGRRPGHAPGAERSPQRLTKSGPGQNVEVARPCCVNVPGGDVGEGGERGAGRTWGVHVSRGSPSVLDLV